MRKIVRIRPVLALLALSLVIAVPNTTSAQSMLQGSAGGLQQQSNQTQDSANTQNQSSAPQSADGETLFNQQSSKSLKVLSSPNQSSPTAVVKPSPTLTTKSETKTQKNRLPQIGLVLALIMIVSASAYLLKPRPSKKSNVQEEKPYTKPEPYKAPKKSKKTTRRKRKKQTKNS